MPATVWRRRENLQPSSAVWSFEQGQAACRTRQQAQTLSNFLVLVLSALGGSMVPRFLMPPWLQTFSWTMPNAWAIEAYHGLLWRNAASTDLALPVGLMLGFALATLAAAWILIWRRQRA